MLSSSLNIALVICYPFLNCSLLVQLKPYKDLDVDDHIKEFAAKLSLIPSPPPGPLHLVNTKDSMFEFAV